MALHRFGPDDIFRNTIRTYPEQVLYVYKGVTYREGEVNLTGSDNMGASIATGFMHKPSGSVSLYELNIDRAPPTHAATALLQFTDKPLDGQQITIISSDGTSLAYMAKNAGEVLGDRSFDNSGTVKAAAQSLRNCIEHASGHNGKILVSEIQPHEPDDYIIVLTQQVPGSDGNKNIVHNLANVNVKSVAFLSDSTLANVASFSKGSDPAETNLIYPFIEAPQPGQTRPIFKTVSRSGGDTSDGYIGSYPLTASITRQYYTDDRSTREKSIRRRVNSLCVALDSYSVFSPHFAHNSGSADVKWDKSVQEMSLISIPSIFYGSSIRRGSVNLDFIIDGVTVARLNDEKENGELIQVSGSNETGSVGGVVLYNHGFLMLTGSWDVYAANEGETYTLADTDLNGALNSVTPAWKYFGAGLTEVNLERKTKKTGQIIDGADEVIEVPTAPREQEIDVTRLSYSGLSDVSFKISFQGTQEINTITMLSHAKRGKVNHSNNSTFLQSGSFMDNPPIAGSTAYIEFPEMVIKNTVSSSYVDPTGSFEKQTFISKVGIFDKDKNLLGIAKMATPVKKTQNRNLTFKIKMDV